MTFDNRDYSKERIIWCFIARQAFTFTPNKNGYRVSVNANVTFYTAVDWLRTNV